jgi:bacterioferritin
MYRHGVAQCEKMGDIVSRDLIAEVLRDEEGHVDFLETQFELIKQMGLPNYIQLQSEPAEE